MRRVQGLNDPNPLCTAKTLAHIDRGSSRKLLSIRNGPPLANSMQATQHVFGHISWVQMLPEQPAVRDICEHKAQTFDLDPNLGAEGGG